MSAPVTCAVCGCQVDEPPVTWTLQTEGGRQQWICADCTRANVRSIEGRLDPEWW